MRAKTIALSVALFAFVVFAAHARAQEIDPGSYYRLTNMFLGEGRALAVSGGGDAAPVMAAAGDDPTQLWKLTPLGEGYYRLTTAALGDDRSLDSNEAAPVIGATGDYSGQYWRLTPAGEGYYRLTNMFLGEGRALDTYADPGNAPFMGQSGNYSGQFWRLTKVELAPQQLTEVSAPPAAAAGLAQFCWKETWGTGAAKAVPTTCGPDQELNGAFCYDKCRDGYTSNRVAGCIQNCPEGAADDGLFCGWPSYKVKEYVSWDECNRNHPAVGCEQPFITIVEKCKPGYRHVAGFCEKIDINCEAMGLMPGRVFNSCAKRTYGREPQRANCPDGLEFGAGLCYEPCGPNADRAGPLCWGKCPAGWVQCGMGCAKDQDACRANTADQIVSVLDSAASIAALIGSMGASAAGKTLMSKAAWTNLKQIGKANAKQVLQSVAVSTALQTPANAAKIANDSVEYLWDLGEIETSDMTEVEKQHAITELTMNSIALFDPSGVTGVVAAYTKPLCKDIAAAR